MVVLASSKVTSSYNHKKQNHCIARRYRHHHGRRVFAFLLEFSVDHHDVFLWPRLRWICNAHGLYIYVPWARPCVSCFYYPSIIVLAWIGLHNNHRGVKKPRERLRRSVIECTNRNCTSGASRNSCAYCSGLACCSTVSSNKCANFYCTFSNFRSSNCTIGYSRCSYLNSINSYKMVTRFFIWIKVNGIVTMLMINLLLICSKGI